MRDRHHVPPRPPQSHRRNGCPPSYDPILADPDPDELEVDLHPIPSARLGIAALILSSTITLLVALGVWKLVEFIARAL